MPPSDHKALQISFDLTGQNSLFIPPLDTGVWIGGVRTFNLLMQNGTTQFLPGLQTPTSGYNGSFLGPTLYIQKGDSVSLTVANALGENTTTHWHGLHVPAAMDGGPHQMIAPGSSWTAAFEMRNEASTFWYHPHHKPNFWQDSNGTGGQVYRGLAGMMIVEDANSDTLNIPNTYGVDEIPLIIQDRAFDDNGEFIEFLNPALAGRPGDTVLVNGTLNAEHQTHAQLIRYRILNASNTRTYYLGFDDNRDFDVIGTDGGFLNSPVSQNRIRISPAERVEIVVDFSQDLGDVIALKSYASELVALMPVFVPALLDDMDTLDYDIMTFNVGAPTVAPIPITSLSSTLNNIVAYDTLLADVQRPFILSNGPPMTINGVSMDMDVINEVIQLGDMELWTITNESGASHPFHIHGEPFQVVARSNGPVEDWEKGWKDVVFVSLRPNIQSPGWVKIIKPFRDFADSINPYMYHCHILEHEDRGMMGQYTVVDDGEWAPCSGDVNGDNAVTVADILVLLIEFGCTSACAADVDGDGSVTVSDVLVVLGGFGSTC
jgi:bilirubin oxidase